jgi:hypothetical protein
MNLRIETPNNIITLPLTNVISMDIIPGKRSVIRFKNIKQITNTNDILILDTDGIVIDGEINYVTLYEE